jgi:hypothetical protein
MIGHHVSRSPHRAVAGVRSDQFGTDARRDFPPSEGEARIEVFWRIQGGDVRLLLLLVLPGLLFASAEPVSVRAGQSCVVCDRPVQESDAGFRIGGQEFSVCDKERDQFLADPQRYIARYRPNNILMNGHEREVVSAAWLWFGIVMTVSVAVVGLLAYRSVRSAGVPAGRSKIRLTRDPVLCPECAGANHPSARRCTSCGAELEPVAPSEARKLREE